MTKKKTKTKPDLALEKINAIIATAYLSAVDDVRDNPALRGVGVRAAALLVTTAAVTASRLGIKKSRFVEAARRTYEELEK